MKLIKSFHFFILGLALPVFTLSADKYETPHAQELRKRLVQCTDHENYDAMDCYRQLDLELAMDKQKELPDNQRAMFGSIGEEVLLEKLTDLKVGEFLVELNKKKLRELQIKEQQMAVGFELGAAAGCRDSNYRILKNHHQFIFLVDTCFAAKYPENRHSLIFYDKKLKGAFSITRTTHSLDPDPTLEWTNGTYRYRWHYTGDDKKPVREFYDFKIKSETEAQCTRTWNDDCPIGPLEKRIVSKNPIEH